MKFCVFRQISPICPPRQVTIQCNYIQPTILSIQIIQSQRFSALNAIQINANNTYKTTINPCLAPKALKLHIPTRTPLARGSLPLNATKHLKINYFRSSEPDNQMFSPTPTGVRFLKFKLNNVASTGTHSVR